MRASAANDFTVRVTVEGLAPATRYYYRLLVDGIADRYRLPAVRDAHGACRRRRRFALAFGSCARHQLDAEQPRLPRDRARRNPTSSSGSATTSTPTPPRTGCSRKTTAASASSPRRCRSCAACRSSRSGTTTTSASTTPTARARSRRLARRVQELLGQPVVRPRRTRRASSSSTPTAASTSSCWTAATTARRTRIADGPDKTFLGRARSVAARGTAREPRAVQGARLRQRLVDRGRAGGRYLGRVPDRAQCALRFHPRQPHRGRGLHLRRHALRRAELHSLVRSAAATTSTIS